MSEELLINVSQFETRVAVVGQNVLHEIHIERAAGYSFTGNIHIGKVERIIPGMQAAFVNVGLARPGFLHVRDIVDQRAVRSEDGSPEKLPDIRSLLRDGQELLVQVIKDPIGNKGARLTTRLSIASRYMVLMPFNDHIGISQKVGNDVERERLVRVVEATRRDENVHMGFIARTAVEGIDEDTIRRDINVLIRMWDRILENRARYGCPALVYEELPLHIRMVRDLAHPGLEKIHIDDESTHERVREFVDQFVPEFSERVSHYDDERPLFERYSIEEEVARALEPRVAMKCGGYLIVEQTEAMTTIDVNTGSFLGSHNLEETVFRTNLEAAGMIPRQLRLRNLGGIIVIDFIDMADVEHQRQVLRTLEKACDLDPARIHLEGFSSLGLVQMSRKRTRESLAQQFCEPCQVCDGVGTVKTSESTCIEVFRAILQDARRRGCDENGEYLIRVPEDVVDRLLDEDAEQLAALSHSINRDVRIQVEPSYGPGQFDVVVIQDARR
ncbi:MAG: Rne/Rng family ribonuclease [Pseudomonadales bacterium]|jgi:ribonuclease G|nr:Rne/Rng family ribonuclease [Pseudomonadales bacterium]MDP6470832.1 Rne/Rng family ribonuclease [Pseudomonadales bacterium]MDP6825983.1 Rne/Rng family ribonuclease [Pseudomonadales bacterium]MDP6972295.1 Rne/Rng family ribonuclease [Pseudomonadales bacterium]|tara:strand:+ start:1190 stop:2689 length:1500 start_codon:yes stop_codon:yes gene_type:complete